MSPFSHEGQERKGAGKNIFRHLVNSPPAAGNINEDKPATAGRNPTETCYLIGNVRADGGCLDSKRR